MTKLAEAIANTIQAAQSGNGVELGTSIVDIVSSSGQGNNLGHFFVCSKCVYCYCVNINNKCIQL